MPPDTPSWWYAPADDRRARALAPIGRVYGWMAEQLYRHGAPYRSRLPVICAGNLTVGGTGKTPLALLVGERLLARGIEPVFLTRGYGGRRRGPHWVGPEDTADDVGDEPLLLARLGRVVVARDRRAGAMAIEARAARPAAIVMDDGLQNPTLEKDLAMAVIDGTRGLGNALVLPAGPLRAPLGFQLELADALLVNGASGPAPAEGPDVLALLRRIFTGPVLAATVAPTGDTSWLSAGPLLAYAGIGNAGRFFELVESLGGRLIDRVAFPDHHRFTERDADRLLKAAGRAGAQLLTTEKDLVRLKGAVGKCRQLEANSRTLPIALRLEERDQVRLEALIDAALKSGPDDQSLPLRRSST